MLSLTLTTVTVTMASDVRLAVLSWCGLYRMGAANTNWTNWVRLSGTKLPPLIGKTSAVLTFALPAGHGPPWELRLFGSSGYSTPLGIYSLTYQSGPSNEGRAVA